MAPRAYRLGKRAAAVEETRARIIEAARDVISSSGFHRMSVDQVADRSGVTRATVYYQFGSKLGLFEAIASDFERRAGHERFDALWRLRPAEMLPAFFRETVRFWATDPILVRHIVGLAAIDDDARRVAEAHDAGRRADLRAMIDRLAGEGLLRTGVNPDHATTVLWLLSSFEAFDQLRNRSSLSLRATTRTLIELSQAITQPLA